MSRTENLLRLALAELLKESFLSSTTHKGTWVQADLRSGQYERLLAARDRATLALEGQLPEQKVLERLQAEQEALGKRIDEATHTLHLVEMGLAGGETT